MSFRVQCYRGLSGLEELKPEWIELYSDCVYPTFYNDWRWHYAFQKHLLTEDIYYFAVYECYETDELVAVVPLVCVITKKFQLSISYVTFPYHVEFPLSDLLIHKNKTDLDILDLILSYIHKERLFRWDILELSRFTERSGTKSAIGKLKAQLMGEQSAYVHCVKTDNLLMGLSKKQIKNVRRQIKKAEQSFGRISFRQVVELEQIQDAYAGFLKLESSGWKGETGTNSAIFLRPEAESFYRELLKSFAYTDQAVINTLGFDCKTVAAQLGLRTDYGLSLLKISYDEQMRDLGPGNILLLHCLEHETGRSLEINLVTNPPWSERWHFQKEEMLFVNIFNKSLYASFLKFLLWVRRRFKS